MKFSNKLSPSVAEIILFIILTVLSAFLIIISESIVPVHYSFSGEPDYFANRNLLLLIPGSGILIYLITRWAKRFRNNFNYPVKITNENKTEQEALTLKLLDSYSLITLFIFNLLLLHLIYISLSGKTTGVWLWGLIFFVGYLLPIPIYLRKAYRKNNF